MGLPPLPCHPGKQQQSTSISFLSPALGTHFPECQACLQVPSPRMLHLPHPMELERVPEIPTSCLGLPEATGDTHTYPWSSSVPPDPPCRQQGPGNRQSLGCRGQWAQQPWVPSPDRPVLGATKSLPRDVHQLQRPSQGEPWGSRAQHPFASALELHLQARWVWGTGEGGGHLGDTREMSHRLCVLTQSWTKCTALL